MKIIAVPALGLSLYVLSGCSGGSSGGADASPAAADINAGNGLVVARATMSALASTQDIGAIEDLLRGLAGARAGPEWPGSSRAAAGLTAPLDAGDIDPCQSGRVRGTVNLGDPELLRRESRLLSGDSFNLDFADCRLAGARRVSGGLDVSVDRFVGSFNGSNVEYLYASTLRDLRIDTVAASHVATGDMQMFFGSTSFPMVFAALSGRRLAIAADGQTATLRDYDLASKGVLVAEPDLVDNVDKIFDGHLSSSEFAGEVRFQTQMPFRTHGQDRGQPIQGELLIFGAGGAVLRLAVAGGLVQLEVDADGDGSYEHQERVSWASLVASG